jgi:hypothetical protein
VKLSDCQPRWVGVVNWSSPSLFAVGLVFTCPVCRFPVLCYFKPSLDPDNLRAKYGWPDAFPAPDGNLQWERTGDSFDTISLMPSINNDKAGCGHWSLTNGELTEAVPHGPRVKRPATPPTQGEVRP